MLIGAIPMVCFGPAIGWLISTVRVFEGVKDSKGKLDGEGSVITDDRFLCPIVQMLARYRDNRRTIGTMVRVCTLGGCCFFLHGIARASKSYL